MKKLFKFISLALVLSETINASDKARRASPPPPPVYGPVIPNMDPSAWEILYSKKIDGMYSYGTGWGFTMPQVPGHVGYVMQNCYGYIPVSSETQTVTMEATVDIIASPDVVFDANTSAANTSTALPAKNPSILREA